MAASRHMGTIRMIAKGRDQLSYCAARTRNTKITRQREHEHVDQVFAGHDLLKRQFGPLEAHALREVVARKFFHHRNGLAGTDTGRRAAADLGRRIHLVAVDDRRPGHVADVGPRVARGIIWPSALRTLSPPISSEAAAELGVGLHVDLPVSALEGEVVDIGRSEVHLEGLEDIVERRAQRLGLGPIDVDEELGLIRR